MSSPTSGDSPAPYKRVATPDLDADFPDLEFFEFVVGHLGIVTAALFLVIGLRLHPRRGAVLRVIAITATYTAVVGGIDWSTGANYMFLAMIPQHPSLLSVLGPWPWYIVNAAAGAVLLFPILDLSFQPLGRTVLDGPNAPARPRASSSTGQCHRRPRATGTSMLRARRRSH